MSNIEAEILQKQRKTLIFTAKRLYEIELFEESLDYFKQAIDMDSCLNPKHCAFLNNLVHALTNPLRVNIKILNDTLTKDKERFKHIYEPLKYIKDNLYGQLIEKCQELLSIIDQQLIPSADNNESKVDLMRIVGDLYRYIIELSNEEDVIKRYSLRSENAYQEAYMLASKSLPIYSLTRLSVVNNRSILLADILGKYKEAIEFADGEIKLLIASNSEINEESYNKAMIFCQMLQNKLTQWRD